MRKIASALVLCIALAGLAGCATTAPYGNFVKNPAAGLDQQKIASDTVQQLVTLYPPAKTRFELEQPTPDPFGQAFVNDLRAKGYALLEFDPQAKKAQQAAPADQASAASATPVPTYTSSLPLRYVFDQAIGMNLYRVTVMVGNQSITRPYVQQDGTAVPAGYWVRKE